MSKIQNLIGQLQIKCDGPCSPPFFAFSGKDGGFKRLREDLSRDGWTSDGKDSDLCPACSRQCAAFA